MRNKFCSRCFKDITDEEGENVNFGVTLHNKKDNWKKCGSVNWRENLCCQCNDDLYNILTIFFSGDKILPMENISKLINNAIYSEQMKYGFPK